LAVVLRRIQWSQLCLGQWGPISSHSSRRIIHPNPGKYDVRICTASRQTQPYTLISLMPSLIPRVVLVQMHASCTECPNVPSSLTGNGIGRCMLLTFGPVSLLAAWQTRLGAETCYSVCPHDACDFVIKVKLWQSCLVSSTPYAT